MNSIKRRLLTVAGAIAVGFGVMGMFLPVLPTTPFLLLAAYCFLRSDRRLYERLLSHKVLGAYIKNFLQNRAIPRRVKVWTLLTLWATILLSVYLVEILAIRILLLIIALAVSIHILRFKDA